MKKLLKILNIFIFLANLFKYLSHLEDYRYSSNYDNYDFNNDSKFL